VSVAQQASLKVLLVLVGAGLDPDGSYYGRTTLLKKALESGSWQIAAFLLEKCEVSQTCGTRSMRWRATDCFYDALAFDRVFTTPLIKRVAIALGPEALLAVAFRRDDVAAAAALFK
jgi:hypothetical protein